MKRKADRRFTAEALLELGRSYQPAAVYAAAADLDLFGALAAGPLSASAIARKLQASLRGIAILLDALVALRLLKKRGGHYSLPVGAEAFLTSDGPHSILAMAQHQANCLRKWVQLARVVKTGRPAEGIPSVRGETGDQAAFIGAMHNIAAPTANQIVRGVSRRPFRHLLDIGGASGTWTIAFLRAARSATATLFDLPPVIPMARRRIVAAGLSRRVKLVAGDFLQDELPGGTDLAWVSAIVHQNSRAQNRRLFANVFQALTAGGRIAIRDVLMDSSRTRPVAGALFAVNMLVATDGGGTFTFDELRADLQASGFTDVVLARRDEGMNAIVTAQKPSVP